MSAPLGEMAQYARFPLATRRYIVKALDFGLPRGDFMARWAGGFFDIPMNLARADLYAGIRLARPLLDTRQPVPENVRALIDRCAAFDLHHDEMHDFVAFEFLYARLFGAAVRPVLPAAYTGAAISDRLTPEGKQSALSGIAMHEQIADSFDAEEPSFFPEWDGD